MADFSFVDGNAPSATTWNANVRDQLFVICTSSTRPTSPTTGRHIWETDTLKSYFYNGSSWVQDGDGLQYAAWTSYTPTWGNSGTANTLGNGTISGYYRVVGKTLDWYIIFTWGSTTASGSGQWYFSLPLSLTSQGTWQLNSGATLVDASAFSWPGAVSFSSNNIYLYCPNAQGDVRLAAVTGTAPFTWVSTDSAHLSGSIWVN